MRAIVLTASALLACAGSADAKPLFKQGTALAPPADAAPSCSPESAKHFVGRPAHGEAENARVAADADTVRVIGPGTMVTQDSRPGRLNLKIDDKGVITAVSCG